MSSHARNEARDLECLGWASRVDCDEARRLLGRYRIALERGELMCATDGCDWPAIPGEFFCGADISETDKPRRKRRARK